MRKKVIVIGAGLGGLLAAAHLSKQGYAVQVFEKMQYIGGRFTGFNYKGYQVPTGAIHIIPFGKNGPLAKMCREANPKIEWIQSDPEFSYFLMDNNYYAGRSVFNVLATGKGVPEKTGMLFDIIKLAYFSGDESLYAWFKKEAGNPHLYRAMDTISRFATGLPAKEIPAKEIGLLMRNFNRYGGSAIPKGGCRAVIEGLKECILKNGGKIKTNCNVEKICLNGTKAVGVELNGKLLGADYIISNAGPAATEKLSGSKETKNHSPVAGVKICVSSKKPLLGHTAILLTADLESISGVVEPTNADTTLAPRGKHLLITHQHVGRRNVRRTIDAGIADLHTLFPDIDKTSGILMVQSYRQNNPVNFAAQGKGCSVETKVKNLFLVGDGVKIPGYIMAERVAMSVKMAIEKMKLLPPP